MSGISTKFSLKETDKFKCYGETLYIKSTIYM